MSNNQNYDSIKSKCLKERTLFEDPDFPAENSKIFFSKAPPIPFQWKRPRELVVNPEFVTSGISRLDVTQGMLDNAWLVAAISSLTCSDVLLRKVVPNEQNFKDGYCGLFKFNIWYEGKWTEVVVDDRLPTYNNKLVFIHSADINEFWGALLEKAFAKLYGSYESLTGGNTSEAIVDFTGGIAEDFDTRKSPENLFNIMLKAYERGSLMGCAIHAKPNETLTKLSNGLLKGHPYSVTSVQMVKTPSCEKLAMVRCRNPWGNEREWTGDFSDNSERWHQISVSEQERIGRTRDDDGEFWMTFSDWQSNFQKLEICNIDPLGLDDEELFKLGKKTWESTIKVGEWISGVSAGGCRNFPETFHANPKFCVTLTDPDDDEDDLCTILIGVLQKNHRKRKQEGLDSLTIGYSIYKIENNQETSSLDKDFFLYNKSEDRSKNFSNAREVCGRHMLKPGTYCIVPSTFQPNQEGEFLLRILTEKANITNEIDEETAMTDEQQNVPPTKEEQEQEERFNMLFRKIAGEDMEIDVNELRDTLNAFFRREFSFDADTCKSMIAMHDCDLSGKLGFEEFKIWGQNLRKYKDVFKKFDTDGSGKLSSYELRSALHACGFKLSNKTLNTLVMRYSKTSGEIHFGDFMLCAVKLKMMLASWKVQQGTVNVDSFIATNIDS